MVKKTKKRTALYAVLTTALLAVLPDAIAAPKPDSNNPLNLTAPPQKKLLEFGWDQFFHADPSYIRDNIREMEKRPFDGIIFRLADGGGEIFKLETWDEKKLEPQLKVVSDIKWDKFTDNFVYLMVASSMDWASDEDWEKVTAHLRFCARAARLAKCKGVVLDPESYGFDPWKYSLQKHASTMSFNQYQTLVRKRGAQFMEAIQTEMPDAVIPMLVMFQTPLGVRGMSDSINIVDPVKRNDNMEHLYIAFLNGMLDVMGPGITLVDGNEPAYYYIDENEYYRSYHQMRQSVKIYIAAENQDKFDRQVRAGQALYVDQVFDMRAPINRFGPGMTMSPEEKAQWFERNVYHALNSADRYAWLYSEGMHWWKNENLPPGLEAATAAARSKIARALPLGFGSGPALTPPSANVSFLDKEPNAAGNKRLPPLVAGASSLTFWDRKLEEAKPFVSAQTAWDRKNLYIDIRCYEPAMPQLKRLATKRDSVSPGINKDDSVEIFISPNAADRGKTFHYVVNSNGALLDAKIDKKGGPENTAWNGHAQVNARREDNRWVARLAIPWSDLEVSDPQAGHKLAANFCRTRYAGGDVIEFGWAPLRHDDYNTPDDFGTLTLQDKSAAAAPLSDTIIIQPANTKAYGSGASLLDSYDDGGIPNLGLFVGHANPHRRNDRVLCKFDLIPLLEVAQNLQKVELTFNTSFVIGKNPERELSILHFPQQVGTLDSKLLSSDATVPVAVVKVTNAGSFSASQTEKTALVPQKVDVTALVRDALAKSQTSITFRWQDDTAEKDRNSDVVTKGTMLSGVASGGLPSLVATTK